MARRTEALVGILLTLTLAACGGGGNDGGGTSNAASSGSAPPSISGSPPTAIAVGEHYAFTPSVSDPEGDQLTFSVTQKPAWLTLDAATGTLTGTPSAVDVGTYRGVELSVSDGQNKTILPPFDIEVPAIGSRVVTLSWLPPTQNEDGSPLTDLAGYEIAYGRQSGMYSTRIDVQNPGVTTYVVSGLVPGAYYFAMSSYNKANVRSRTSAELAINIQ